MPADERSWAATGMQGTFAQTKTGWTIKQAHTPLNFTPYASVCVDQCSAPLAFVYSYESMWKNLSLLYRAPSSLATTDQNTQTGMQRRCNFSFFFLFFLFLPLKHFLPNDHPRVQLRFLQVLVTNDLFRLVSEISPFVYRFFTWFCNVRVNSFLLTSFSWLVMVIDNDVVYKRHCNDLSKQMNFLTRLECNIVFNVTARMHVAWGNEFPDSFWYDTI